MENVLIGSLIKNFLFSFMGIGVERLPLNLQSEFRFKMVHLKSPFCLSNHSCDYEQKLGLDFSKKFLVCFSGEGVRRNSCLIISLPFRSNFWKGSTYKVSTIRNVSLFVRFYERNGLHFRNTVETVMILVEGVHLSSLAVPGFFTAFRY